MKALCKCGKYAHADSAVSLQATCGNCGRVWLWYCGPHENDWTMVHEPLAIATLTAQCDRLLAEVTEAKADAEAAKARANRAAMDEQRKWMEILGQPVSGNCKIDVNGDVLTISEFVAQYQADIDQRDRLAKLMRDCRRMLNAMNTSPAHAVSWIEPRTTATKDMVASIDDALAKLDKP